MWESIRERNYRLKKKELFIWAYPAVCMCMCVGNNWRLIAINLCVGGSVLATGSSITSMANSVACVEGVKLTCTFSYMLCVIMAIL